MVKTIQLTQGKVALVEDKDFDELNRYKWYAYHIHNLWYVARKISINGKRKIIKMHRIIINAPVGMDVDHVNHDGLDNRRCNLRVCTHSQNIKNGRKHKNNTSGLSGMQWHKRAGKWMAQITKDYKNIYLGLFTDKVEAGKVVDRKAIELYGEFATLNFPEEKYD